MWIWLFVFLTYWMRRRDNERMTRAEYYAPGCEGGNHTAGDCRTQRALIPQNCQDLPFSTLNVNSYQKVNLSSYDNRTEIYLLRILTQENLPSIHPAIAAFVYKNRNENSFESGPLSWFRPGNSFNTQFLPGRVHLAHAVESRVLYVE